MLDKVLSQAQKMAAKAKPGILKIDNKTYTLVFDQNEWVYRVYEDGFLFTSFNTKSINSAKTMLKDFLKN